MFFWNGVKTMEMNIRMVKSRQNKGGKSKLIRQVGAFITMVFLMVILMGVTAVPVFAEDGSSEGIDGIYKKMTEMGANFNQDLIDLMESIKDMPYDDKYNKSNKLTLWGSIEKLAGAFVPVAMTLATFFFLLGFLKKTIMFEFVTMESVVKCLLRLVVAKIIISNSLIVVIGFAKTMEEIMDITLLATGIPEEPPSFYDPDQEIDIVGTVIGVAWGAFKLFTGLTFLEKIITIVLEFPYFLVMLICKFVIFIQLWGRFLQICLFAIVSPLPLSTLVAEETSGIAKKFIQNYVAVLLQGLLIFLMVHLYIVFISVMNEDFFMGLSSLHVQLVVSILLVFMVAKSGNWAKQIMGIG